MPRDASTRSGRAADDLRIVGALDGHLGPRIQLEAILDEQVGAPELQHEARTDLELVGVLRPSRERLELDEIAADLVGKRLEVGDGSSPRGSCRRPRRPEAMVR